MFLFNNNYYKLLYPNCELKYNSDIYYEKLYDDYKFTDWPTLDSTLDILIENKLWTKDGNFHLGNMLKQIDNLKIELYQSFFNPQRQRGVRLKLNNLKNSYNNYYNIRHCIDHITIEGFCENLKNQYLLYNSLHVQQTNKEYQKMCELQDIDSIDLEPLAKEINRHSIDISIFRKLARSDLWKSYWSANKELIFNRATIDLTDEQRTLIVFSRMYDSARESPENPPDPVFDDDDMFDGWLLMQHEKYNDSKKSKNTESNSNNKMSKAQEMFIVAKRSEDAVDVHNLNSNSNKAIIKERSNAIKKSSGLDASELPDTKRAIQKQSQEMFKQKFKKR